MNYNKLSTKHLIKEYKKSKRRLNKTKKKSQRGINPNINQISSHYFNHGKYKIIWEKPRDCHGDCTDPSHREIRINPRIDDKKLLKIMIDESIHSCLWALDNDYVYDMSDYISDFLYRVGFRLEKKN
jgi:hypothetical protein